MKKTTYFYLYNETTDANTSPRYKSTLTQQTDSISLNFYAYDTLDYRGRTWYGRAFWNTTEGVYDNAKDRPGCGTTCPSFFISSGSTNYINASYVVYSTDLADELFRYSGQATYPNPLEYKFNVSNGDYVVKLYFSNATGTINDTDRRLLMDILLEGTTYKTGYSPYETIRDIVSPTATPTNTLQCQEFDVTVSDGVLNVQLNMNASSYYAPMIAGLSIQKRRHQ
jgi:hypothetical protein